MEVHYSPASDVYVRVRSPVPLDQEIPTWVSFSGLEALGPKYVETPLDELFRHCMERLELPLRAITMALPRRGGLPPQVFPPRLRFMAYTGEFDPVHEDTPLPNAVYRRIVTDGVFFDSIERGEMSLETLEKWIKETPPLGEEVEISLYTGSMTLRDGFDPVESGAQAWRDHDYSSVRTRRLTLEPKGTPWFKIEEIQQDLENVTIEEAVEDVKDRLERALEAEKQRFLF